MPAAREVRRLARSASATSRGATTKAIRTGVEGADQLDFASAKQR